MRKKLKFTRMRVMTLGDPAGLLPSEGHTRLPSSLVPRLLGLVLELCINCDSVVVVIEP
jgi:hypothetical protein